MAEITYEQLKKILRRPVAFYSVFAKIAGSATAGLMLSQMWYWSTTEHVEKADGWFYKTREQWEEETSLTRQEQENARKALLQKGLLEERRAGMPARTYFKLNTVKLLSLMNGEESRVESREKHIDSVIKIYESSFKKLSELGHKRAIKLNVHAELVDYAGVYRRDEANCHICKNFVEGGPGQKRNQLQFDHVVPLGAGGAHTAENLRVTHAGCNLAKSQDDTALIAELKMAEVPPTSWPKSSQQDGRSLANKMAEVPPTSWPKSSQQDGRSLANKMAEVPPTSWPKSSQHLKKDLKRDLRENKTEIRKEFVSPSLDTNQSSQKSLVSISSFSEKLVEPKLNSEPQQTALAIRNSETLEQTKTLTNQQKLLEAFVLLLRLDMRIYKGGYARLAKEISRFYNAEITPEQVQKFAKWWYTEDFRGQKDQPPTLDQFSKLLTTALHWTDPDTIQIDQPIAEITVSRPQQQPKLITNKAIQTQQMIDAMFEAKRRKTQC